MVVVPDAVKMLVDLLAHQPACTISGPAAVHEK